MLRVDAVQMTAGRRITRQGLRHPLDKLTNGFVVGTGEKDVIWPAAVLTASHDNAVDQRRASVGLCQCPAVPKKSMN